MAKFRDILGYFRPYLATAILSMAAASMFEIIDLVVPYAIGQILNVLSAQPVDAAIAPLTALIEISVNKYSSLAVLMRLILVVTVMRVRAVTPQKLIYSNPLPYAKLLCYCY